MALFIITFILISMTNIKKFYFLFSLIYFFTGLTSLFSAGYNFSEKINEDTASADVKYLLPGQQLRQSVCMNGIWNFKSHVDTFWTKIPVPGSYTGVRKMWGGFVWDSWDYPVRWQDKGATYKRNFIVPAYMQGRNITFSCGGSAHHTRVYVNAHFAGESYDAWRPFEFEITRFLKDGPNELVVEITDEPSMLFSDLRTNLRGIWRDTWLNAYGDLSVDKDAFVTTSVREKCIAVETPVINHTPHDKRFFVRYFMTNAKGKVVLTFNGGWYRVAGNDTLTVKSQSVWEHPHLWFPYDPYLYHIHIVLYNERMQPVDHDSIRFGFREITWKGPHLYMNGREMFLHGHGGHAEGDLMESRAFYQAWFGNLKKRGIGYIRLHNGPKDAVLYEVADEIGFLLEAEPAFHFKVPKDTAFALKHLGGMVRLLRNHPSVIVWSVSNELRWRGGGEKKFLIDYVHSLDTTRPVFASDFSLQSRFGDVVGHHYNPKTVFNEWEKYGPDKPMIWDELGSVWQHDRPMENGTAGYEVSAQDYATGLWYDGHEQILKDIEESINGKVFNGELHRPNIFIPWDISYNFFRFQPVNKNRPMKLHWDHYNTCGIKIAKIKPAASTVNIWDPTLPVMEPNPGFYLFSKHLPQIRFLHEDKTVTYFGGQKITRTGKLYYEDLRLVDTVACRIESPEGLVYWKNRVPFTIRQGQIRDNVTFTFQLPEVTRVTPVKLIREFRYQGRPGYQHVEEVTVFPVLGVSGINLQGHKVGILDPQGKLQPILKRLRIPFKNLKNRKDIHYPDIEVLITTGVSESTEEMLSFINDGGRWVVFKEDKSRSESPDMRQVNMLTEKFDGETGEVTRSKPFASSSGRVWQVRLSDGDKVKVTKNTLVEQFNRLDLHTASGKNVLIYAETGNRFISRPDRGLIALRYSYAGWNAKPAPETYIRSIRVVLRDIEGRWYVSDKDHKVMLDKGTGMVTASLLEMQWHPLKVEKKYFSVSEMPAKNQPDFSKVTGFGILIDPEQSEDHDLFIQKLELRGDALPAAYIPLNGARHLLLKDIDQRYLTWWRGGSSQMILKPPAGKMSYHNILLGNKDGMGSALYEAFAGKGMCIVTSLNIPGQTEKEPAAARMLKNILEYTAWYRPSEKPAKTLLWTGPGTKKLMDSTGLIYTEEGDLTGCRSLVIDGQDTASVAKVSSRTKEIQTFVRNGGHVWIQQVTEESLPVFRELVSGKLQLTNPFRGQRSHCVKAAVSWTLKHTPKTPVEYYDSILIPQPFEPNFDPLLSGLANYDLQWKGQEMFKKGIEVKGMDPVNPTGEALILISNWGIDWSQPDLFGEYIHEAQDWQRATWFVNRDPVVLKVKRGSGYFVLSQLDFAKGGEKGTRLLAQLLTGIGCAIGTPANLPKEDYLFDFSANKDQRRRFAVTAPLLPPVQRLYYGSSPELTETIFPSRSRDKNAVATVLMIHDSIIQHSLIAVRKELEGRYDLHVSKPVETTRDLLQNLDNIIGTNHWNTIVVTVGLEDLRKKDGKSRISPEEFRQNLEQIIRRLKKTGAKLYWTTILPVPRDDNRYNSGDVVHYNKIAWDIMDKQGVYMIDLYNFVTKLFPELQTQPQLQPTKEEWEEVGHQIADGILLFGAQF